jgi:hypothetical protein
MDVPSLIALASIQEQPGAIIVKIVPPKSDLATLSDVLLNSLGLSGAIAVFAVLLGLAIGGLMFWFRQRSA